MRERLIDLLTNDLHRADNPLQFTSDEIVERLADMLLANGVIVPPCKVGDMVYIVRHCKNEIESLNVIQIEKDRDNLWIRADAGIMHCVRPYTDYCYTREEAEQALKGGAQE